MEKNQYTATELLPALNDTAAQWQRVLQAFSPKGFNTKPFSESWTAAQVADHILLSNQSVIAACTSPGTPSDRDPAARVPELAGIFLDFSSRFPAAEAIWPRRQRYDQVGQVLALGKSFQAMQDSAVLYDLSESVQHRAFGAITRLELLHFVCFHCRRHLRQLMHIYSVTEQKEYRFLSFLFQPPVLF